MNLYKYHWHLRALLYIKPNNIESPDLWDAKLMSVAPDSTGLTCSSYLQFPGGFENVGQRGVSAAESLPCRNILGGFPSLPAAETPLPYCRAREVAPSVPVQRMLLFPAGCPGLASALQERRTPEAERRREEQQSPALRLQPLMPTLQGWLVW